MALRAARWLALAIVVVGYPLLAHFTNASTTSDSNDNLGAVLALVPLLFIALIAVWRSRHRALLLVLLALCCGATIAAWPLLAKHFGAIYFVQHAGIQILLGAIFGRTLVGSDTPLCTQLARAIHAASPLSPEHERYTRRVTLAWTLFFAFMAVTSALLFFLAPLATWSLFANFLTPLLVALMFLAEYGVRRRAIPHAPHAHLLDAIRAYHANAGVAKQTPRA